MKQTLNGRLTFAVCVSTLWFAISLCGSMPAAAQTPGKDDEAPKIVVWVYNYAAIPKDTMASAEREVQKIFGAAAVRFEWVKCPTSAEEVKAQPVCQDRMSNLEIGLTILSTARGVADAYVDKYFGIAEVYNDGTFGHYAYVFADRVGYRAQLNQISESQLLGCVIGHEFGHVLLQSATHSKSGIMRTRWDQDDLKYITWGQLRFTPEEAGRIHAEALVRLRSPAGRPAIARGAAPPRNR